MGFSQIFTDVISKLETIEVDNPISNPKPSNNIPKTPSNVNRVFKTINIWNDQIDTEIQSTKQGEKPVIFGGYIIKCPACFIEFVPNEGFQILGGVTQYPNAAMYFHLFSDELNTPNSIGGNYMDMNLSIYGLRDLINSNFLGFHTHNSSAMMSRYDKLDYKHGTITKYLRGFNFCFNDDKGSIFDPKSSRYLIPTQINASLVLIEGLNNWVSESNYTAFISVVNIVGIEGVTNGVYICIVSNSSAEFTTSEWAQVAYWQHGLSYIIDDYVFINNYVWKCIVPNSDINFDENNWVLICRV